MKVVVIIINYNSHQDTIEAVRSVLKSRIPRLWQRKILVVENGSSRPGEWEALQVLKDIAGVELIKNLKNEGFTGGNNLGINLGKEWGADFFLLLNPDTKVAEDFLIELIEPFLNSEYQMPNAGEVGIASPKIYFYPGFEFHHERYKESERGKVIWYGGGILDWKNVVGGHRDVDSVDKVGNKVNEINQINKENEYQETDFATGCCMLIKKEVIDKIGMLDQKLFFSWEDTDFSFRAKRAGFKVVYVPKSVIWHKNANTSGGAGSNFQDFYQTRNRLIFAFRYAKWKIKLLLLWQLIRSGDANRLKAVVSAFASFLV